MSDLAATNCQNSCSSGCGCGCGNDGGFNNCFWLLLILLCCNNGNDCGCGCGNDNLIWLILILCCCGMAVVSVLPATAVDVAAAADSLLIY